VGKGRSLPKKGAPERPAGKISPFNEKKFYNNHT